MSKPPDKTWHLSETLTLCQYDSPKNGNFGFWLYDETRGMNLAIRAATAQHALVDALNYYQKRLLKVEKEHDEIAKKVDAFVSQFVKPEESAE